MNAISAAIGEAFVCEYPVDERIAVFCVEYGTLTCHSAALYEDPLLVRNYGTMGVLAFIAGILFWLSYCHLDAEEDALNELDTGKLDS